MAGEVCPARPLFGGAISSIFPLRFEDVSNIRQVPDNQDVFTDPSRDESLIIELLEYKHDVAATWFLRDLAHEQDAELEPVIQQSGALEAPQRTIPALLSTAAAQIVYVANLRLKEVATDVVIAAYEPTIINPLSESAATVGAGLAVPAAQSGHGGGLSASCFEPQGQ